MQGIVTDIQRFSIHDGPGIRTLVFMKGCPLRCPWCSNRETQLRDPEIAFFEHRRIGCGDCVQACPAKAIQRIGETTGSGDLAEEPARRGDGAAGAENLSLLQRSGPGRGLRSASDSDRRVHLRVCRDRHPLPLLLPGHRLSNTSPVDYNVSGRHYERSLGIPHPEASAGGKTQDCQNQKP